jgi:rSAM/selenodomain-associated transferase 1
MSTALIIFAKAPVAGLAKTRLIPALGAEGAAALAVRLLEHTVAVASSAGFHRVEICAAPDATHPAFQGLQARYAAALSAQGEGGLGARMNRALGRALQRHSRALLIGTDAPALDRMRLLQAESALSQSEAVFVPAHDGGYVLVGLRRSAPELFADIAWGSGDVMEMTRNRARIAGIRWLELEPVADIDEPADLVHLPAGWTQ